MAFGFLIPTLTMRRPSARAVGLCAMVLVWPATAEAVQVFDLGVSQVGSFDMVVVAGPGLGQTRTVSDTTHIGEVELHISDDSQLGQIVFYGSGAGVFADPAFGSLAPINMMTFTDPGFPGGAQSTTYVKNVSGTTLFGFGFTAGALLIDLNAMGAQTNNDPASVPPPFPPTTLENHFFSRVNAFNVDTWGSVTGAFLASDAVGLSPVNLAAAETSLVQGDPLFLIIPAGSTLETYTLVPPTSLDHRVNTEAQVFSLTSVPEPSALLLISFGLLGLAWRSRSRPHRNGLEHSAARSGGGVLHTCEARS